ncbi:MAG: heparan-alpha-glucosaminide N-acetyltransferase domain-containing protein [Exilispira sp.]|jgi:predicted acyltransferase|nr:heparan-alpha-glucosaminide N-acetyltransferase domain-containing protein [Exilispira sp.]
MENKTDLQNSYVQNVIARNERRVEIDYFRGFTIILMVFVNFIASGRSTPIWLKHAEDIGLTITDLIAPAFIFAIGLTYRSSFDRRLKEKGINYTYNHFISRFLAIIGIGSFFTAGAAIMAQNESQGCWGVLQAIGAAGLITLIFIKMNKFFRLFIGISLLVFYQIIMDKFFLKIILESAHGGLIASISWASLLIISTFFAELFYYDKIKKFYYLIVCILFLIFGIGISRYFPISKHRVSISYILISLSISGICLFIFFLITKIKFLKLNFLIWWGHNPLFLYLMHMILLGVTFIPQNQRIFLTAPFEIILLEFSFFFLILSISAYLLFRKKIYIKI